MDFRVFNEILMLILLNVIHPSKVGKLKLFLTI